VRPAWGATTGTDPRGERERPRRTPTNWDRLGGSLSCRPYSGRGSATSSGHSGRMRSAVAHTDADCMRFRVWLYPPWIFNDVAVISRSSQPKQT